MKTLAVLAAAGFSALAPSAARAQPVSAPSGPDTYLQLRGGAFVPQHSDLDGYSTGFDFGILFGVRIEDHVGVEGGVGYYRATYGKRDAAFDVEETLGVLPLTASLRLRQAFKLAEVSVLGGVGVHFARVATDTTVLPSPPGTSNSSSASSQPFGYHVGAGAAFNAWSNMLVGVEVVRTFVPARFDAVHTRIDGLRADLTLTYRL